jgi:exodeoxyribonuclease III
MIKVITCNLNGIRSATRKGWLEWIGQQQADVVCVQELKAQADDLEPPLQVLETASGKPLQGHFHFAAKPGYSGVGLYSRKKPKSVRIGFGNAEFDAEGRYVEADFGKLTAISLYLPSGSSSPERQEAKFRFLAQFMPHLEALIRSGREVVVCGDLNIAHQEIDLKNWKSNQKNSGFLPEERAWMTRLLSEIGWVDVYRKLEPLATDASYTWWSNRGAAWDKNVGWRLDYQLATPALAARATSASVYKAQRFSDHAPLSVEYSGTL